MSANLSKKSEKSLIFLIWKQRKIINGFARQIKSLLAENSYIRNLKDTYESELRTANREHENWEKYFKMWADSRDECRELRNKIAYLKGRLASLTEKKEREVSNA